MNITKRLQALFLEGILEASSYRGEKRQRDKRSGESNKMKYVYENLLFVR